MEGTRAMIGDQHSLPAREARAARASARATPAVSHFTCSRCGLDDVRRSGRADILASLAQKTGFRIYRCRACHASYFEQL